MNVILVHGLLGNPKNAWFPWLTKELESRGYTVNSLKMPNPAAPERVKWVRTLRDAIVEPQKTILVGHSLGCPTILHSVGYVTNGPFPHIILVAGFGRPFSKVLDSWFPAPLDFFKIRQKALRWTVIHSKNDALVPYEEGAWLATQLGARLVTKNNGHFRIHEGGRNLPEVLDAIVL